MAANVFAYETENGVRVRSRTNLACERLTKDVRYTPHSILEEPLMRKNSENEGDSGDVYENTWASDKMCQKYSGFVTEKSRHLQIPDAKWVAGPLFHGFRTTRLCFE